MIEPQIKNEWIKALISGEYKQNFNGILKDKNNNYCALGVLCDIMNTPHILQDDYLFVFNEGVEYAYTVPVGFCGLDKGQIRCLVKLDAGMQASFGEIACWIEDNL